MAQSTTDLWIKLSSTLAAVSFALTTFGNLIPSQIRTYLNRIFHKYFSFFNQRLRITFHEYSEDPYRRSEAYTAIRNYLSRDCSKLKSLKSDLAKNGSLIFNMDDKEVISDKFKGIHIQWTSCKQELPSTRKSSDDNDPPRYYELTVNQRYRDIITKSYIDHVITQGKAIAIKNRGRKLHSNLPSSCRKGSMWVYVAFEHPASFDTLALPFQLKKEIKDDLIKFSMGKDYYAKMGKAWKRGYLLHGPPGTGKSTMIAAMANFLSYDVYDLELTAVNENSDLRRLLMETSGKSIIVIEDIDCSLDLTGQRKEKNPISRKKKEEEEESSKVTLSGLLNFIDGIWSACEGEQIIVFTTNYVEKLDPALIRRGRMDKHIHLSYCCFEAFKILANNYLDIESHALFPDIEKLLGETNITPADVAEHLMPKSDEEDVDVCLKKLINALNKAKAEEEKKKAEEEAAETNNEMEEKDE
ncbi:P-loop containing nucleoside triphosphate hydrolases superfamily protein [Euphorbia peplus]|nr:P-loop containing nucleoside triphosphate hydrolases superfamily protein [Euphorbia peplus]